MRRRDFLSTLIAAPLVACEPDMRCAIGTYIDGGGGQYPIIPVDQPPLGDLIASVPVRFDLIGSEGPIEYDPGRSERVSALADQSANAYEFMQAKAIRQPISILETATQIGLRFGGAVTGGNGDCLVATNLDLPIAGTTNTYILAVIRLTTRSSGKRFFGTEIGTACREVFMVQVEGDWFIGMINGAAQGNLLACPAEGDLFLLEALFTGANTNNRLRAGTETASGADVGNRDRDGFVIGRGSNTDGNAEFDLFSALCTDGEISDGEKTAIRAALLTRYPAIILGSFGA